MKIAVIGTGKTGGELLKLIPPEDLVGPFNTHNQPTLQNLKADVAILFVPASAVEALIPLLIEANLPAIWGTTGYTWPNSLHTTLHEHSLTWIYANNYSLGITALKPLLNHLAKHPLPASYHIHEVHHTYKQDAPSGTALAMQHWLSPIPCPITSERKGDIPGTHTLTLTLANETLTFTHTAKNRSPFAQGALFAAHNLHQLPFGFHPFEKLL